MARTKMEVEALANKISREIHISNEKKIKAKIPEAKKVYNKLKPFLKQLEVLRKQQDKVHKKLANISGLQYISNRDTPEMLTYEIARKLARIKDFHNSIIWDEIILAGDQGADVLIKKITQMFV